jgi:peptidoglycan hydrolase-like protein with peptidoglycan-binding domain
MGSAADALNRMRSYLGVHEDPPHSNRTIIGEKFGWNGVAWCAETVSVCEDEASVPFNGSASCWILITRYKSGENGIWLGNPGAAALLPGDEFFIGSVGQDHTGMVEAVDGDTVITVEGNWGDKVCRMSRHVSAFYGFGRPNYTDQPSSPGLPPPSATAGRPVLRLGNRGKSVSDLQAFLNAFDNAGLVVDGDFGPATDTAVKHWQAQKGLEVDGVVGPDTYKTTDAAVAYVASLSAPPPPPSTPPFPGTVRLGSRGGAVRLVQQILANRGWKLAVDGDFGRNTDKVVRAYQGEKGLTVDGIVGPQTWVSMCTSPVT